MFGVVVTKATMSTSCNIRPLRGKREKWGGGGGGRRVFSSVSPASVFVLESCDKPWLFQFF